MEIVNTDIEGLKILNFNVFRDKRGELFKPWDPNSVSQIFGDNLETYVSFSRSKTLRGLHYQIGDGKQKKIITCLSGAIDDLIVDLNINSKTFGKSIKIKLTGFSGVAILIPEMCAHGTYAYEDSIYQVISDNIYMPSLERGVRWLSIDKFRHYDVEHISQKDINLPDFIK